MSEPPPRVLRVRRRSTLVADHLSPDMVSESPFQTAHRFVVGLPGGDLGVVVGAAGAATHPDLSEGDDVQRQVQLAVSATRQAVSASVG